MTRHAVSVVLGLSIASAVVAPLSNWLERSMLLHMLVQLPAIYLAGGLIAGQGGTGKTMSWNHAGISGLLASSLIVTYWMTPIALDHATQSRVWDIAKVVSVLLAGSVGFSSWGIAPLVVRAFFMGNFVWMGVTAGVLYQDETRRLCNAYLQDDQVWTGEVLVWGSIAAGVLWISLWPLPSRSADHPS